MVTESPIVAASRARYRSGNFNAAVLLINREMELAPDGGKEPRNLYLRGLYYEALGRYADAASDFQGAIPSLEIDEEKNDAKFRLANVLRLAGNTKGSERAFEGLAMTKDRKPILRMQVFLNNQGFTNVPITGENDAATGDALKACLSTPACKAEASRYL
jgi:tetratricopeptide (TPR) repeat protein